MDGTEINNPQKPLDDLVAGLISNAKADGFTLGLLERAGVGADGSKRIEVSVVETIPPVDTYEPPPPLRGHILGDTSSLIEFATKYGTEKNSLVLYTDAGVSARPFPTPESCHETQDPRRPIHRNPRHALAVSHPPMTHPGHLEENGVDGQRAGMEMVWPGTDA